MRWEFLSNEVPLRKTNLVVIPGMILVARRMIIRNSSGRLGEGNWKGLGAFKIFLIINYNRQGWGAAFSVIIPMGADAEAGGNRRKQMMGGRLEERGSSWWGLP